MKRISLNLTILGCLAIFLFSGCVEKEVEKMELVGLGHTFRDLRQHTFSESKEKTFSSVDISPDGQRMAVVLDESGNKDIYIKAVNAKAMTQKTFHKSDDSFPCFSPDGSKIAFASKRNGNWDIFVMNANKGRAKRQVTSSPDMEIAPSWSPDGKTIAFSKLSASSGEWEIWTYNLTNGALTSLVPGFLATYSPHQDLIAFQRSANSIKEGKSWYAIWIIDSSGSQETLIVSSEKEGYINPEWSNDGNKLVFSSGGSAQKAKLISKNDYKSYDVTLARKAGDIYTINIDGTNMTQLTTHDGEDYSPTFSSSGRIFFVSKRNNYSNIWSVQPEYVEY